MKVSSTLRKIKLKYALLSSAIALLFVISASLSVSVSGYSAGNGTILNSCTHTKVAVTPPKSFKALASYTCILSAKTKSGSTVPPNSWVPTIYSISNSKGSMLTVHVKITDCCFVGDFFGLWGTTDPTLKTGWVGLGVTPEVHTGSQLKAPTYDTFWTGTGTTYSSKTFTVSIPPGTTYYFAVDDLLFALMGSKLDKPCGVTTTTLLSSGCHVSGISVASSWSPGGLSLSFS